MPLPPALERDLQSLGLDASSARTLALLPLVQVAWADGAVQDAERALVLEQARQLAVPPDGAMVLANWLSYPPSAALLGRGHRALGEIVATRSLPEVVPTDVVGYCQELARAAGGLFGVGATSRAEAAAIAQIAAALGVGERRTPPETPPEPPPAPAPAPAKGVTVTFHTREVGGLRSKAALVGEDGARCPVGRAGVVVGRNRECDVQVAHDGEVSRKHFRLEERERKHYVLDLGSTSGTFVDGDRVNERRLFGGEALRAGTCTFRFALDGP